ncbi:isochorismatase family protein [Bordetella pseudohinzii]|nr:isochorismatase family protein [Bordetella pseudohinzii]CUI36496.1 N-carbamoylsarcosine amidase [Bordetella pseudohinzii]
MSIWSDVIPAQEIEIYQQAGFGRRAGLGRRPALLIIDVQYRTVGTLRQPIGEAMKEYPTACGEAGWQAVDALRPLLALFRERDWPVLYPHVALKVSTDAGRLGAKVPAIMDIPAHGYDFVEAVAPRERDILVPKKHPSAFFGTALVSHLVDLGADTLVVAGCTTSGCVRASVVDAFSYNFHVVVPAECVYDRGSTPHKASLFDMNQKYADVMSTEAVMQALRRL